MEGPEWLHPPSSYQDNEARSWGGRQSKVPPRSSHHGTVQTLQRYLFVWSSQLWRNGELAITTIELRPIMKMIYYGYSIQIIMQLSFLYI